MAFPPQQTARRCTNRIAKGGACGHDSVDRTRWPLESALNERLANLAADLAYAALDKRIQFR